MKVSLDRFGQVCSEFWFDCRPTRPITGVNLTETGRRSANTSAKGSPQSWLTKELETEKDIFNKFLVAKYFQWEKIISKKQTRPKGKPRWHKKRPTSKAIGKKVKGWRGKTVENLRAHKTSSWESKVNGQKRLSDIRWKGKSKIQRPFVFFPSTENKRRLFLNEKRQKTAFSLPLWSDKG